MATQSTASSRSVGFRRGSTFAGARKHALCRQSPGAKIVRVWVLIILLSFRNGAVLSAAVTASASEAVVSMDGESEVRPDNSNVGVEAVFAASGPDGTVEENKDSNERKESASSCFDETDECVSWAEIGECDANPQYMLQVCKKSCRMCWDSDSEQGQQHAFGEPQVAQGDRATETMEVIRQTEDYMLKTVFVDEAYRSVRTECKNRHELCSYWKVLGECAANPAYMIINCGPACRSCEKIDIANRCPLTDVVDALGPGDLNALFERISDSDIPEYAQYKPAVLSRPGGPEDKPWVVTFESFLSPEECDRLIELGSVEGYKRSTGVGPANFDGTLANLETSTRTSRHTWCQDECYQDPAARRVMDRIASVTGIPEENSEHIQLLKYEVGQFYESHHDFIPPHVQRPPGPRVLTFFLYLNDVDRGGGTHFDSLNITVMPKRGKALVWPSVLDEAPNSIDDRTYHQAMPVERGVKYAANAWLHQKDFKSPYAKACI